MKPETTKVVVHELMQETRTPQKVSIPQLGKILSVGLTQDCISVWVEIDQEAPKVERTFYVFWTGQEIPPLKLRHLGTVITKNGLVWHVFEEEPVA